MPIFATIAAVAGTAAAGIAKAATAGGKAVASGAKTAGRGLKSAGSAGVSSGVLPMAAFGLGSSALQYSQNSRLMSQQSELNTKSYKERLAATQEALNKEGVPITAMFNRNQLTYAGTGTGISQPLGSSRFSEISNAGMNFFGPGNVMTDRKSNPKKTPTRSAGVQTRPSGLTTSKTQTYQPGMRSIAVTANTNPKSNVTGVQVGTSTQSVPAHSSSTTYTNNTTRTISQNMSSSVQPIPPKPDRSLNKLAQKRTPRTASNNKQNNKLFDDISGSDRIGLVSGRPNYFPPKPGFSNISNLFKPTPKPRFFDAYEVQPATRAGRNYKRFY